jgi:hypothetical protein
MAANSTMIAAELNRLRVIDPEGYLNPASVVRAARDDASPLHQYFNWDDGDAADRYRLFQAGVLIRRVRVHLVQVRREARQIDVQVVKVAPPPRSVRVFQAPRGGRGLGGGYRATADIANDDVLAADMVDTLRSEFTGTLRRAQDYCDAAIACGRDVTALQEVVTGMAEILNSAWPPETFDRDSGDGDLVTAE